MDRPTVCVPRPYTLSRSDPPGRRFWRSARLSIPQPQRPTMRVGVIGATGYVGGRLVPQLLDAGHEVRCIARNPDRLDLVPWRDEVTVVAGDVLIRPPSTRRCRSSTRCSTWCTPWARATSRSATATAPATPRPRPPPRGCRTDRLPRRAGRGRVRCAVAASRQPARGGHRARRRAGAGHRASCCGDHRVGQRLVRDASPPRRGPADDGVPALGHDDAVPADRHRRRAALPGRRARPRRDRRPGARDRRPRRVDLPPDDGPLRRRRRLEEAGHHPRQRALAPVVVALDQPGDAPPLPACPAAGGQPGQRRGRRSRAATSAASSSTRPYGFDEALRQGHEPRPGSRRAHRVDGQRADPKRGLAHAPGP